MPSCLIVERDGATVERLRAALTADGWQVRAAADREAAERSVPRPDLMVVGSRTEGAADLVRSFSGRRSASRAVVLLEPMDPPEAFPDADASLRKPVEADSLRSLARTLVPRGPAAAEPARPNADEPFKLTSADIFGDMLAELASDGPPPPAPAPPPAIPTAIPQAATLPLPRTDLPSSAVPPPSPPAAQPAPGPPAAPAPRAPAPRPPAAGQDDLQKRLEQTLSGLLEASPPRAKPAASPAAERPAQEKKLGDVDKLLSQTLSGLDIGLEKREKRRPAPAAPQVPGPSATLAPATPPAAAPPRPPAAVVEPPPPPLPADPLEGLDLSFFDAVEKASLPQAPATTGPGEAAEPGEAADVDGRPSEGGPEGDQEAEQLAPVSTDEAEPSLPEAVELEPFIVEAVAPPAEVEASFELVPIEQEAVELEIGDVEPAGSPVAEWPAASPEPAPAPAAAVEPVPAQVAPVVAAGPPASGPAGTGRDQFGHYTLLERVAFGGMAEVWKARMDGVAGFQKTVAIKKILPHLTDNKEFERMFVDEAKLAAELNHPNIIHIYDLGVLQGEYYIAMEYVEGKNLRTVLDLAGRKGMPIPLELGLLIAARLASALDYAHRKRDTEDRLLGLVHRDVSPQNVLLSFEGDIKLCDFGIVKAVAKLSRTEHGALKGKLQYMSPEQAWGRDVDARSDIFSLGALLFEMLTGLHLFSGESELSVLEAVRDCRIRRPTEFDPSIPAQVDDVVLKALARDPQDRYPTAGRMRDGIEACLEALTLRPTNAELAAYLRRLLSSPELGEGTMGGGPPRRESQAKLSTAGLTPAASPYPAPAVGAAASSPQPAPSPALASPARPAIATQPAPGPVAPAPLAAAAGHQRPFSEPPVVAAAPVRELPPDEARGSRLWVWVAILLLVAGAAYYALKLRKGGPAGDAEAPAAEQAPATSGEPAAVESETDAGAAAASETSLDTRALLAEERKKIEEAAAAELARQRAEAERAFSAEEKRLRSTIEKLSEGQADIALPGPGVRPPVLVSMDKPKYPPEAAGGPDGGEIVVSVLVDAGGRVEDVQRASDAGVDESIVNAAVVAARSAEFKPATRDGERVRMWTTLRIPLPR